MKRDYYKNAFKKLNKHLENEVLKIILKIEDNLEEGLEQQAKINYGKLEELYKICMLINISKKIYKKNKILIDEINNILG